jgi:hypothetical protein
MAAIAAAAAGASVISGAIGASKAGKAAKKAAQRAAAAQLEMDKIKASRQEVINPYENVTDLSSQLSNPYNQLGVATQAAEMQAEEADIALANTLDTLRATGASAGGATALAQAALRSKKNISSSIEQQEAQNEKLKAQGEQQLQQLQLSEKQRVQALQAEGAAWQFTVQENRINADLDRAAGQLSNAQAQQASSNQAQAAAWGGVASSVGSIAGAAFGSGS